MDTEKKSPIKCPACNEENPRNKLICVGCGERLAETITKMSKRTRKKKVDESKTETVAPNNPELLEQEKTEESPLPKPRKTRSSRSRRPKETPQFPIFFILAGSKLKAVRVAFNITVPLRRKDLPKDARNLLSLWNRNKDIIKNA